MIHKRFRVFGHFAILKNGVGELISRSLWDKIRLSSGSPGCWFFKFFVRPAGWIFFLLKIKTNGMEVYRSGGALGGIAV